MHWNQLGVMHFKIKTAYNMCFAKMAGDVILEIFLHLTKFYAGRQFCAFYPPSSQSAIVVGKLKRKPNAHCTHLQIAQSNPHQN
jgi:hypothetical protein